MSLNDVELISGYRQPTTFLISTVNKVLISIGQPGSLAKSLKLKLVPGTKLTSLKL